VLVGSVPNAFNVQNRLRFLRGLPPERDRTHLHLFRPQDLEELLSGFSELRLSFVGGRYVRLSPRLFAQDIVFTARRP
jgi:hypothetical protein